MEYAVRLYAPDVRRERILISDVAGLFRSQEFRYACSGVVIWFGVWREGEAVDFCAELGEPEAQPGAFESGVTGYEDCFVFEN